MAKDRPSRLRPLTLRLLTAPARAHWRYSLWLNHHLSIFTATIPLLGLNKQISAL
ncbi:hypothetical protein GM657_09400 [Lacticaseibacillus rhamnosus GG]|nr:hypothetical protein N507_0599 [Lacticaseibacillus rhamnosus DSM 14870]MSC24286.1 hypothetical protein [Lacticaseibacillus rhamnosus]QOX84315.1 hypothetical protein GM657_09400 [Lacticaseibacillus rhamnosus GG]CAR87768.1 Putative protein without homology [Lacticaseibacillus rhamnosus GG]